MMRWFICMILGCCVIFGCEISDVQNIRSYYFPVDNLTEGLVYEYHPVENDSLPVEYWYYRTLETDSATYLTAVYYDNNFVVRQVSNEEIVSNGVIRYNHYLYEFDSTGIQHQVPAKIISNNSFPFEVRDSGGVFVLNLEWDLQQEPKASMSLIRNRQYGGQTKYPFKGENLDCVIFNLREQVEYHQEGYLELPSYLGKEYYAKGLGLVYYKKEISENLILEYELVDTFSMKVLESRFK